MFQLVPLIKCKQRSKRELKKSALNGLRWTGSSFISFKRSVGHTKAQAVLWLRKEKKAKPRGMAFENDIATGNETKTVAILTRRAARITYTGITCTQDTFTVNVGHVSRCRYPCAPTGRITCSTRPRSRLTDCPALGPRPNRRPTVRDIACVSIQSSATGATAARCSSRTHADETMAQALRVKLTGR